MKDLRVARLSESVRVVTRTIAGLFEDGLSEASKYTGSKWGGFNLRAPDIFITRLLPNMRKLSAYAHIEGYIHGNNVGVNYPPKYFVDSINALSSIILTRESPGVELYGIRPSGNSLLLADLLYPRMISDRFFVPIVLDEVYGQKFYKIVLHNKNDKWVMAGLANSTVSVGMNEIVGNVVWGQGAISVNGPDVKIFPVLDVALLTPTQRRQIEAAIRTLGERATKSIFEEIGFPVCRNARCPHPEHPYEHVVPEELTLENVQKASPDRYELDRVVFDALGLTDEERLEVYQAIAALVKERLVKAQSSTARGGG